MLNGVNGKEQAANDKLIILAISCIQLATASQGTLGAMCGQQGYAKLG